MAAKKITSSPICQRSIDRQSHLAFTNWNQGLKTSIFEEIGFGTILEDKTGLQPMDEVAWVNQQQWDVDMEPYAPQAAVRKGA